MLLHGQHTKRRLDGKMLQGMRCLQPRFGRCSFAALPNLAQKREPKCQDPRLKSRSEFHWRAVPTDMTASHLNDGHITLLQDEPEMMLLLVLA